MRRGGLSLPRGAARARRGTGRARRGARRGGARARGASSSSRASRGSARPRSSRGSCRSSTPARGCCSAPATTSRSRGRSGPIRDLVGTVSRPLEEALADGRGVARDPEPADRRARAAAAADGARARGRALGRRRDARLDHGARAGGSARCRRCSCSPTGAARRRQPLRAALGAIRAEDAVFVDLAPLSERAVASLAGDGASDVYAATAGNPFYVTELLAARPGRRAAAVRRERGARTRVAAGRLGPAARGARLGRAGPRRDGRARRRDAGLAGGGRGARAAAAARGRREVRPLPARAARGTRSGRASRAPRGAGCTRRSSKRCSRRTPIRPTSSTTPRPRAPRTSSPSTRSSPRGGRRRWSRTARRTRTTSAPPTSPGGCRRSEQAAVFEELAQLAYVVGRLDDAFPAIERAIALHGELGDEAAVGRCTRLLSRLHWFAGAGAPARIKARDAVAILEPLGDSVELARAYGGMSQLAMLAERAGAGASRGASGRSSWPTGSATSTRASTRSSTSARRGPSSTTARRPRLLEAHAVADAIGEREEATRALGNLAYVLMSWVHAGRRRPGTWRRRSRTPRCTRCTTSRRTSARRSRGSGCVRARGRRPSG